METPAAVDRAAKLAAVQKLQEQLVLLQRLQMLKAAKENAKGMQACALSPAFS